MYLSRELRRGLTILLLIVAFFGADFLGLFSRLNDIFYDQFTFATPGPKAVSKVLIIEAPADKRGAYDEATWRHIIDESRKKGARKIAFTFYPPVSRQFYLDANATNDVLFGRAVIPSAFDPEKKIFERLPAAATDISLPSGAWTLPSSASGDYQSQYFTIEVSGKTHDSLTAAVIKSLGDTSVIPPSGDTFMVNFTGGIDRVPAISIELAASGGLIEELARDRIIVVGFGSPLGSPGLKIPGGQGAELSPVEYFGYGLDTLITSGAPQKAQPWMVALLLVLVTFIPYLIRNMFDLGQFVVVNAIFAIGYVAALGGVFFYLLLFAPVATVIMTHLVIVGLIGQWKAVDETQAVRTLVIESSVNLHKRVFPTNFSEVDEHWSHVISVVNQLLDLERVIFLERIQGDHRVREVIALNCSIEDINEMRRDYERAPYSDAIAANGPCRIDNRIFMRPREDINEEQYLVPLIFSGEMLGFWAFTIDTARIEVTPVFLAMVKDFTVQISELLYRRYYRQLTADGAATSLTKNPAQDNIKELDRTISLLNHRLSQLEDVLDEISVATIMYDLFGQVIQINQSMVALSQEVGVAPHDLTALDFIMTMTGIDIRTARRHLNEVVLNHRSVAFPITAGAGAGVESLTINIYPLLHREQGGGDAFHMQGILCEIWDVSEMESVYQNRERAFKELLASVEKRGQALIAETKDARKKGISEQELFASVASGTEELVGMVKRAEKRIAPTDEKQLFKELLAPVEEKAMALIDEIKGARKNGISGQALFASVVSGTEELAGMVKQTEKQIDPTDEKPAIIKLLASVEEKAKALIDEIKGARKNGISGQALFASVVSGLEDMGGMIKQAENQIAPTEEKRVLSRATPVDTHEALINAIKMVGHELTSKRLTVAFDTPERRAMALATHTGLPEVMADILRALSHTANTSGVIEVTSRGSTGQVNFSFFADGLGLSPERLQEMLYQPDTFGDGFAALGQDIETVKGWQGEMRVTSEVGRGISVDLSLEAIH